MIHALRVARAAAGVQLREVSVNGFMLFAAVFQPFFIGLTAMLVLRHRPDFDPTYVIVGTALSGIWSTLLFAGSAGIMHERWTGSLELIVAAPTSLFLVVGGRMAGTLAFTGSSLVLSYAIGALLFGYEVRLAQPASFVASLALAGAALWATAMLLAPLSILWRSVGRFLGVLEYPVFAMSGFLFPILLLPGWTAPVSYALPPYWAAVALHGTSSGDLDAAGVLQAWLLLLATGAVLIALARRLFDLVLIRARVAGTLALS